MVSGENEATADRCAMCGRDRDGYNLDGYDDKGYDRDGESLGVLSRQGRVRVRTVLRQRV